MGQRSVRDLAVVASVVASLIVASLGTFSTLAGASIASVTREPIFIDGDAGFTPANGVVRGAGTSLDPFILEGWEIRPGPRNGIEIRNTTAAFLIRTVRVHDADYNRLGVYLLNVTGARLENSSISTNNWVGVMITKSRSVIVENNYFARNSGGGVFLVETVDAVVRDNVFSGNTGGGLGLGRSDRVEIMNNVFDRNYVGGVFWAGSADPLGSGQNTTIHANRFIANGGDIDLMETANVTIIANKIDGASGPGGAGVFLRRARDISIVANNVSAHAGGGLSLWWSSNITLRESVIRDNNAWGLYLYSSTIVFVHDVDFVTNWQQVRIEQSSALVWQQAYPLGGNYWGDYVGSDVCTGPAQDICTGPDGFGDTPYLINFANQDRYPRMTSRGLPSVSPVASLVPQPLVGNVTTNFTLNASFSWDLNDPSSRLEFRWDWDSDGAWDTDWKKDSVGVHRYDLPGVYSARVEVRDAENLTDTATGLVVVEPPELEPSSSVTVIVLVAAILIASTVLGLTLLLIRRRRRRNAPRVP